MWFAVFENNKEALLMPITAPSTTTKTTFVNLGFVCNLRVIGIYIYKAYIYMLYSPFLTPQDTAHIHRWMRKTDNRIAKHRDRAPFWAPHTHQPDPQEEHHIICSPLSPFPSLTCQTVVGCVYPSSIQRVGQYMAYLRCWWFSFTSHSYPCSTHWLTVIHSLPYFVTRDIFT